MIKQGIVCLSATTHVFCRTTIHIQIRVKGLTIRYITILALGNIIVTREDAHQITPDFVTNILRFTFKSPSFLVLYSRDISTLPCLPGNKIPKPFPPPSCFTFGKV